MPKKLTDPRGGAITEVDDGNTLGGQSSPDYYEDDYYEDVTISISSLHKARRYQIIAIVFLLVSILACGAWFFLGKTMTSNKQIQCFTYQVNVEQLAENYMTVNGFSSLPAYVEDIPNFGQIASSCPDGGQYTWNPVTGEYSCSFHGHHPDGFAAPQSSTVATNTEAVVEEE